MKQSGVSVRRILQSFLPILLLVRLAAAASSDLPDAAGNQDWARLRTLLAQKTDVHATQPDGATALQWAVRWDQQEIIDLLIRSGADVNAANRFGVTPLKIACTDGSAASIGKLIAAGVNPNKPFSERGETALMEAAKSGSVEAVRVLLNHGADVNARENTKGQTALIWAAAESHPAVVRLLIEHGADVNARSNIQAKGLGPKGAGGPAQSVLNVNPGQDACPLLNAPPKPITVFGTAGPAIRTKANGGGCMSSLHFAARQGDDETTRVLLDAGAQINLTMGDGTTALLLAIVNAHFQLAKTLLDRGADPNIVDGKGMGALYAAVNMRNVMTSDVPQARPDGFDPLELIHAILEHQANPNLRLTGKVPFRGGTDPTWQSEVGATPFLRAAYSNDVVVMRLLLAWGADPGIAASDKTTPLMAAAGVGWLPSLVYTRNENLIESLKLCLELGNDINVANDGHPNSGGPSGLTALHGAAFKGLPEGVQFLVDHGADLFARDAGEGDPGSKSKGRVALEWAEGVYFEGQPPRRQEKTVELLQKLMAASTPKTAAGN
jgi:ankyrin repeat protein